MHHFILFSFQLINMAFITHFNNSQYVRVSQTAPGTFSVVKNSSKLIRLFGLFQQLGIKPICYSNKKFQICAPVLKAINPNLQWIYIIHDKNNYPHIPSNRAQLQRQEDGTQIIAYGQGLSGVQGKEQLRLSLCSALNIDKQESKRMFIIFEDYAQEIARLKQEGYLNIYSSFPNNQQQLLKIKEDLKQKLVYKQGVENNKQYEELIKNSPNLSDQKLIEKILDFHYFQNKKNVSVSIGLGLKSSAPSIYRPPHSFSICSLVFRYSGDKQIYVGKSQLPAKIGGQMYHEGEEDKILASTIYQILLQNSNKNSKHNKTICLPMYLSNFTMRNCLVKGYNNNKAIFIVKPFINGFKTIAEEFNDKYKQQEALLLAKQGRFKGKEVRGIGRIIALSLICNQQFLIKGLFNTIALYKYKKSEKKNQLQQQDGRQINCCRTEILECFKERKIKKLSQIQIKLLSTGVKVKIQQLYSGYLRQMQQTIIQICEFFPLIQSMFTHHIWKYQKNNQLDIFKHNLVYLYTTMIQKQQLLQQNIKNGLQFMSSLTKIQNINPRLLNYMICSSVDQKFSYFVKYQQDAEMKQYGFAYNPQNVYHSKLSQNGNFIIYGPCVPILSLIKWIKSTQPSKQIRYMSLLHVKTQAYIKYLKIAKTQQKKNILFIVDHCEIEESGQDIPQDKTIADINYGIRTIFIYRLKLGSCKKLPILHDPLTSNRQGQFSVSQKLKLPYSQQQLFKTIFSIQNNSKKQQNLFDSYKNAIFLYLKNKWLTIGYKTGIHSFGILKNKLEYLVKSIALKNNRLVILLKCNQLNDFNLYYNQNIPIHQLNSQSDQFNKGSPIINQSQVDNLQHIRKVPKAQIILYCLPIYIYNQRVWLIHDIFSYLSAYFLYEQILQATWNGNLLGQQLQNFKQWYPHINASQKGKIKKNLKHLIKKFQTQKTNNINMTTQDPFTDCIELCQRIGMQQIFCKLDKMFYLTKNVSELISLNKQHNQFVLTTTETSMYKISKQMKQNKQDWKIQTLHEGKQSQQNYQQVGLRIQGYQQQSKIVSYWIELDEKKQYKLLQNVLKIKQKINTRNQLIQKQIKFNHKGNNIKKVYMVEDRYIVILQDNGRVSFVGYPNHGQNIGSGYIGQTCYPWKLVSNQNSIMISMNYQQKLISFNNKSKVYISHRKQGNNNFYLTIVVAMDQKQNIINQNKQIINAYPLALLGFRIGENFQISDPIQNIYANKNKIKSINTNFIDNQEAKYIQILTFQEGTDALLIWKSTGKGPIPINHRQTETITNLEVRIQIEKNIPKLIQNPSSKYYRVQNQPIFAKKFNNTLFVGSKYSMLKKMSLKQQSPNKNQKNAQKSHNLKQNTKKQQMQVQQKIMREI